MPPLTPPVDTSLENVTWIYRGPSIPNDTTGNIDLGIFRVATTIDMPSPPTPTLNWVGTLDGTTATTEGTVSVNVVPEPSSVILLLIGAGAVPLYVYRTRRRRLARSA